LAPSTKPQLLNIEVKKGK